jgi:hypothetical protein
MRRSKGDCGGGKVAEMTDERGKRNSKENH